MEKNRHIGWVCLIASGLLEIVWAYFMKESNGFTVPLPTIITIVILTASFFLLERAIRTFGIGISYAVFTGIGIVGTTLIGIVALGETASLLKLLFVGILMVGIIGIRLVDSRDAAKAFEEKYSLDGEAKRTGSLSL